MPVLYVPMVQLRHCALSLVEYVPAMQARHWVTDVMPMDVSYVPPAHKVHATKPDPVV